MEVEDRWDNEYDESDEDEKQPFLESTTPVKDGEPFTAKRIWKKFFEIFVSIALGVYAGFICRTMQEAWLYAALFSGEALVCACVSGLVKSYSFKKSISAFSLYFVISAITTPIASWLQLMFT